MYLHIGQEVTLLTGKIVGVFDLDNASRCRDTRNFLQAAEQDGQLITIGDGLPRTFVLMSDGQAYLTPISAGTIAKRLYHYEL